MRFSPLNGLIVIFVDFLKPLTGCARVAANPERRTSAGVFSEAWLSHNTLTTFADVNDVVTCLFNLRTRIASP